MIIDGKPGDEDGECFPPLLRFELDADGRITKGPNDVESTDARQGAYDHDRAAARIASDLLGFSSDQRTERLPRRTMPILNRRLGPLMNLCIVFGLATIVIWNGLTTNEAFLDRTLHLVNSSLSETARKAIAYGTPQSTVVRVLEHGESLLSDVMKRGPLTAEAEYRRATVLLQFARAYMELGDTERALARADDARHLLLMLRSRSRTTPTSSAVWESRKRIWGRSEQSGRSRLTSARLGRHSLRCGTRLGEDNSPRSPPFGYAKYKSRLHR
ncbi:hypothetical protein AUC71_08885 [Methyloceanibacter marginalis]|uniref:Uncharacterized protein n=1 Tax=Methyloceanibacter marginalis TaxID=1774971 RepID=A0A1E3WCN6_9HYPH|nr:hypothetical protein AUC71_08885 [Methyloceanibacter marginalis]